jgi:predicted DNA-binding transcriptional regulator AlpA
MTNAGTAAAAGITLIRLKTVMEDWALPERGLCAPDFPKPVKLGGRRSVAWVSSEVDQWISSTIAASRGTAA